MRAVNAKAIVSEMLPNLFLAVGMFELSRGFEKVFGSLAKFYAPSLACAKCKGLDFNYD